MPYAMPKRETKRGATRGNLHLIYELPYHMQIAGIRWVLLLQRATTHLEPQIDYDGQAPPEPKPPYGKTMTQNPNFKDPEMAKLVEEAKKRPPMTREQRLEQKVSFAMSMLPSGSTMTKEEVRELMHKRYE